jgi:hypothetical protein
LPKLNVIRIKFCVQYVERRTQIMGTYKVRNEINENETKRNQQKRNGKRNQRNENETNENKTKYDARLLPTHVSVSFTRRG